MLTYDQFLPNITGIIQKQWNLLQRKKKRILKKDLQELFEEELITAFKKKQEPKRTNSKYEQWERKGEEAK